MARTLMVLVVLLYTVAAPLTCSTGDGLRIKLTHVDAKGNYTMAELVRRAVDRSRQRLAMIAAGHDVSAPVHWAQSQYIAEYLIGNPPQRAEALIDTGSSLIWTQCSTCTLGGNCFQQNLPRYDPSQSSSAQHVACTDATCKANPPSGCSRQGGNQCVFAASYGAGDIAGELDTETFTFQSSTAKLTFGCVTASRITLGALDGASGLIGLGRDSSSLVSQTGATKFSYCLTPYFRANSAPSHLFVGASARMSGGSPVMSMQFVKSSSTFYYLPLVGLTVGETKLPIPSTLFKLKGDSGGVIIDSGSPTTSLVDGAYKALRNELVRQLNASLVAPPRGSNTDLCVGQNDLVNGKLPDLVFHFSGADMTVPPRNYWAPVDKSTACMMIFSSTDSSTIGNFQQQNMHLLYDVARGTLSFQTADCSAL
uniref:Aspartic proteinase nepenthesin-1-like protein n=1 Tax=Thinopyrum intermedium TaxID=85679 RepID=A0A219LT04_9POAL|nr:aspartic proteinase nepenthesin-1-like protein [Thinopyrum intermedium]